MDGIHSGEAKDSDTYAEGSSGKDDIDTEDGIDTKDGSGRARLQYRGGVKRAVSIRSAVVERMVQEVA